MASVRGLLLGLPAVILSQQRYNGNSNDRHYPRQSERYRKSSSTDGLPKGHGDGSGPDGDAELPDDAQD